MFDRACENKECAERFQVPSRAYRKRYCSSSCAAHVNNTLHPKRKLKGACKFCSIPITSSRTYCDLHKRSDSKFSFLDSDKEITLLLRPIEAAKIQSWIDGIWEGGSSRRLSSIIRKYVLTRANYACEVCGFNQPHPKDGASILK